GGMVPGTHTRRLRTRPVQVYSHATCGVPYRRRRHTDGVRTPTMVDQNCAADSGVTSGGAAMVTHCAPVAWRRCRHASSWSRPNTLATNSPARTNASHGRVAMPCHRLVIHEVTGVVMRPLPDRLPRERAPHRRRGCGRGYGNARRPA